MKLKDEIEKKAADRGARFFGVADLSEAGEFIKEQGGDIVASFPKAVSVGIPLPDTIVDLLPNRKQHAVKVAYRSQAYDVINARLDSLVSELGGRIQEDGFDVYPVSASKRVDSKKICGVFSNKLAAHLAGLGWIGKSCMLITPERGPRVRWATVLTNAPLESTGGSTQEMCAECTECVDICPVNAYTGRAFSADEPREARFDAGKCNAYQSALREKDGLGVCGLCLYVCPYGRDGGRQ